MSFEAIAEAKRVALVELPVIAVTCAQCPESHDLRTASWWYASCSHSECPQRDSCRRVASALNRPGMEWGTT